MANNDSFQVESVPGSRHRANANPGGDYGDSVNSPETREAARDLDTLPQKEPGSESESEFEAFEDRYNVNFVRKTTFSKSYTATEEQAVIRKLDRRLTLALTGLYLLSFLDRSNIGNARVAGLEAGLGITSSEYEWTLTTFYITYITFEWMILLYRLVPPHIYIPSCVFAWGLVACLQSVVTNFTQLLVLRAFLGITEAAFGPGVPFYMTFFYRREELAYRVGLQISAAPLATSFASSLAWVIVKLSENGPLDSWRALFLVEGFPSIIAAVFAYYIIPDSPAKTPWLNARERKIATLRLRGDSSSQLSSASESSSHSPSKLNRADLLTTLIDPKAWLTSLMFLSVNVSFASLPVFLPTIINDMSFSPLTSQILAAPPYLVAFAFVLLIARWSDRVPDSRGFFLMLCASLSCLSYAVIALIGILAARGIVPPTPSIIIRYIAIYGAAMGLFSSVVLIITWQLNNQASVTGRGVAMMVLNVVGQTGPLIGVRLFPAGHSPYFVTGMAVSAGFMALVAALAGGLRLYLRILNRRGGDVDGDGDRDGREFEMVGLRSHRRAGVGKNEDGSEDDVGVEDEDGDGLTVVKERTAFRYML